MSRVAIPHQNALSAAAEESVLEYLPASDLGRRAQWLAAVSKRVGSPDVADLLRGYAVEMAVEAEVRKRVSIAQARNTGASVFLTAGSDDPADLPPRLPRQGGGPQ